MSTTPSDQPEDIWSNVPEVGRLEKSMSVPQGGDVQNAVSPTTPKVPNASVPVENPFVIPQEVSALYRALFGCDPSRLGIQIPRPPKPVSPFIERLPLIIWAGVDQRNSGQRRQFGLFSKDVPWEEITLQRLMDALGSVSVVCPIPTEKIVSVRRSGDLPYALVADVRLTLPPPALLIPSVSMKLRQSFATFEEILWTLLYQLRTEGMFLGESTSGIAAVGSSCNAPPPLSASLIQGTKRIQSPGPWVPVVRWESNCNLAILRMSLLDIVRQTQEGRGIQVMRVATSLRPVDPDEAKRLLTPPQEDDEN